VSAIEAKFDPLLQSPLMGAKREQLALNLRVVFHSHYAIYYLPAERELIILRVLHGARDSLAIAEQGGFRT
jgi:plasmid stabilization system protein ParE